MKPSIICKPQSLLHTYQKNPVHGKQWENTKLPFSLRKRKQLYISLLIFFSQTDDTLGWLSHKGTKEQLRRIRVSWQLIYAMGSDIIVSSTSGKRAAALTWNSSCCAITRVPQDKLMSKTSVKKLFSLNMANVKIQCWARIESKQSFWRSCKAGYFWFYDFEKTHCLKWKQNAYSKMILQSPSQACLCLENQYVINLLNNTLQRGL